MVLENKIIFSFLFLTIFSILNADEYYRECDFNDDGKISTRKTYKADGVPKVIAKKNMYAN